MKPLAFIPARKGSKGLPGKNLKLLCGKPLIEYTLDAAMGVSDLEVFVSTNDEGILDLAQKKGLPTDYRRPDEFAQDESPMVDAIEHGLSWLKEKGKIPPLLILLQPTSPFRSSKDIVSALDLLKKTGAPSVIGVSPLFQHPSECIHLTQKGWDYLVPPQGTARQEYDSNYYFLNGSIYCCRTELFLREKKFLFSETQFYKMPLANSVDIDTLEDFVMAEALMKETNGKL